ncbi:MAG: ABC transporter ATP-binding protein [Alphaproteobacteria bacterium]|nr:ABC transporter ATP-binding protein [Alphaproteobacteria bacterium]
MTRLKIAALEKHFDKVAAVKGIDLDVTEGELVSLLGPSGCGKTTTLRCVAGFELPTGGSITFDGADVTMLPPEKRDIGMVFQNYALFPHMTVRQNLGFGLEMRKVAGPEMDRRLADVLGMVQLGGMEARYPRQLSGGQQQRVALARALVIEPKLLLLDEPLANLDAKLRDEMRFFIRGLQQRVGITTLYVTHDQAEAMVMSDKIVVMFDGLIHQVGNAREIYDHPATRQVASFIGLSNFIEGEVLGRDGERFRLRTSLGEISCGGGFAPPVGSRATAMVRPEAIAFDRGSPPGSFPGKVTERYFLGNLLDYRVAMADGTVLQVQQPATAGFAPGDAVAVTLPAERAWLVRDRIE